MELTKNQTIFILNYYKLLEENIRIIVELEKSISSKYKISIVCILFIDSETIEDSQIKLSEILMTKKNLNINNRLNKNEYQAISTPIYTFKENQTNILIEQFLNKDDYIEKTKRFFYVI